MGKFDTVREEQRLFTGLVPDVLTFLNGAPRTAIEVRQTHAVNDEKASRFDIPFFEVLAADIITAPNRWKAVRSNFDTPCPDCVNQQKHREEWRAETERLRLANESKQQAYRAPFQRYAESFGVPLPRPIAGRFDGMRMAPCKQCHRETIIFDITAFIHLGTLQDWSSEQLEGLDPRWWSPFFVYRNWFDEDWERPASGWIWCPVILCLHCKGAATDDVAFRTRDEFERKLKRE